jgi:threonine aldolase
VPSALIDLRSDTVTEPTEQMREAIATAPVGDDGYGEDPTVNELEATFARLIGTEAAMLVPSGVMANQIALRTLTAPGDVVLVGERQHVVLYEMGAAGVNAGVQLGLLEDGRGIVGADDVVAARAAAAHHQPAPTALFLEVSHMASGGTVPTIEELAAVRAAGSGLRLHIDGARLLNASVATGIEPSRLVAGADSVMTCLSKGLCCPVGSMFAGSFELVSRARVERKRLGGAMRQAGIIAAAGLVALDTMVERLADDHRRARAIASAVGERWPSAAPALDGQVTNLVVFEHDDTASLLDHLATDGIAAGTLAPGVVRFVTHRGIDDQAVERTIESIRRAP